MAPHIIFLVPWVFQPIFVDLGPKLGVLQKALCPPPKMAKIQPGGRKTARRAAERPPTGKPKLSRVTSGCGEDIIPLSRVRETTKKWFRAKNSIFGPQKGHFGQSGPRNGPPAGQTATYRKTEGIQSYLRIWGTYDPIESWPFELKKWGFHRCSVKKCKIWGLKCSFSGPAAGPWPAVQRSQHKKVVFLVSCHDGIKIFG